MRNDQCWKSREFLKVLKQARTQEPVYYSRNVEVEVATQVLLAAWVWGPSRGVKRKRESGRKRSEPYLTVISERALPNRKIKTKEDQPSSIFYRVDIVPRNDHYAKVNRLWKDTVFVESFFDLPPHRPPPRSSIFTRIPSTIYTFARERSSIRFFNRPAPFLGNVEYLCCTR